MKPWRRPTRYDLSDDEKCVVYQRGAELDTINPDELFTLLAIRRRVDELTLGDSPDSEALSLCNERAERNRQTALALVQRLELPKQ